MTLENQVTSLELSKKLKELGVKQDSLFYWAEKQEHTFIHTSLWQKIAYDVYQTFEPKRTTVSKPTAKLYSAYTVAELGELLPEGFVVSKRKDNAGYECYVFKYEKEPFIEAHEIRDTLPNTMAATLIYLKENNLT